MVSVELTQCVNLSLFNIKDILFLFRKMPVQPQSPLSGDTAVSVGQIPVSSDRPVFINEQLQFVRRNRFRDSRRPARQIFPAVPFGEFSHVPISPVTGQLS